MLYLVSTTVQQSVCIVTVITVYYKYIHFKASRFVYTPVHFGISVFCNVLDINIWVFCKIIVKFTSRVFSLYSSLLNIN